jgi:hypothetical protein
MKTPPQESKLEKILNKLSENRYIFGIVVNTESRDDTFYCKGKCP